MDGEIEIRYSRISFLIPTTDPSVWVYLRMYPLARVCSCLARLSWRFPLLSPPCVQHMAIVMEGKRK